MSNAELARVQELYTSNFGLEPATAG
jgi:hypothetical protein